MALYTLNCCVVPIVFPSDILFPYDVCDKVFVPDFIRIKYQRVG